MSIRERKEKEREERRELILNAAGNIIKEEGFENLSIRKIAAKIEYSPAIIYHYFKDKDDIINNLMKINYGNIVDILSSADISDESPEIRIRRQLKKYIEWALSAPEEYKTALLSSSEEILNHTSTLFEGASVKRHALSILAKEIKSYCKNMDEKEIELTAQIIWTSTFGLILRLIIEKDTPQKQRDALIEHHINFILNGIKKRS
jgi:AcrR family transcriptional regulator